MSLFDFLLPEQAQATHLRKIANTQRTRAKRSSRRQDALVERVQSLEDDVGFLALVLGALIQKADEKGAITRDEIRAAVTEIDELDGAKDGKIDVNILRGMGS